jgi:hypothetical protein
MLPPVPTIPHSAQAKPRGVLEKLHMTEGERRGDGGRRRWGEPAREGDVGRFGI